MKDKIREAKLQGAKAVLKWLEIRDKEGNEFPIDFNKLCIDFDHSELLIRIIDDGKIYDYPPPVRFGYPWYSLLDNGKANPQDVFEPTNDDFSEAYKSTYGFDVLIIDQFLWKVYKKINDEEWIVQYLTGKNFDRISDTKWRVFKEEDIWTIERWDNGHTKS